MGESLVGAAVGPGGFEAEAVAVLEPCGYLFDGGLLQVTGEGRLPGGRRRPRQDITSGILNAANAERRMKNGERGR